MPPSIPQHFQIKFDPQPDPAAVVTAGAARFTVLSDRLLRLEYSPAGQFEERPSQTFWFRRQPVPAFTTARQGETLEISTPHLRLRYTGGEFSRRTLSVYVIATGRTWHFGEADPENLGGTARTLDDVDGAVWLGRGLVSRSGWAVVDDSHSLVFDGRGWLAPRQAGPPNLDLYFFGHGHDYLGALGDFCAVAGPTPLIPRWALGNWWSRFWEYTQAGYLALMEEFRARQVPLAVAIIDMDWHITHTGNQSSGWTGYTWNRQLFPDPDAFLAGLAQAGLKIALNVHPAEGIHPHEEQYPALAARLGLQPPAEGAEPQPVNFDIADPNFTAAYFDLLHHPQEARGVNFWWIDWQQGQLSSLPGLDPLYWLNHLHFHDLARDGRRPFIFSRWPGLGGHRYPIGFSGDTKITWASLAFQPHFTATAANVAYGWWSHDIGGHMAGRPEPELYARWVQYGVFSPILRLHATKSPLIERRPWAYDCEIERVASAALRLRHALIPYLYSMAWRTTRESRPLILPMYYLYPEAPEAYRCPNQYWFGSELLAAPFVAPRGDDTGLSQQGVWLPEGDWFDFFSGEYHPGGRWLSLHGELDQIPVFARAGAIVPLDTSGSLSSPAALEVHIFPGAGGVFELYEDDGESQAYTRGERVITRLWQSWEGERLCFHIDPPEGQVELLPARRRWTLVFHGLRRPEQTGLRLNGAAWAGPALQWVEDESAERLTLSILELAPGDELELELLGAGSLLSRRDRRLEKLRRMLFLFRAEERLTGEIWHALPEILAGKTSLLQYANRLTSAQLEALNSVVSR